MHTKGVQKKAIGPIQNIQFQRITWISVAFTHLIFFSLSGLIYISKPLNSIHQFNCQICVLCIEKEHDFLVKESYFCRTNLILIPNFYDLIQFN